VPLRRIWGESHDQHGGRSDGREPGTAGAQASPICKFSCSRRGAEVTKTHWHIALANGLGWGFDGMDSMVFSLVSPLVITEFALDLPSYRSGVQIALFVGIAGLYFWPWLADRYGRRNLLAINIALFSLLMPVVALAPSFAVFVVGRSVVNFALNGDGRWDLCWWRRPGQRACARG
jgi:hypothetical protein